MTNQQHQQPTRTLAFLQVDWDGWDAGTAILNPIYHDYDDLFSDGVVLTVYFVGNMASRIARNRLRYDDQRDLCYFCKGGRRHYLENMPIVPNVPHDYTMLP